MSDESQPLSGRQLAEINKALERAMQNIVGDVTHRRNIVDLVLRSGKFTPQEFREILEVVEQFVHKPVLEIPRIEVKLTT